MSADDQAFLDVLSSIPRDLQRYTDNVTDYVDKHVDQIAQHLREAIATAQWAQWVPEQIRPRPPPPAPVLTVPTSTLERIQDWVSRHKILTGFLVIATGTVVYRTYRTSAHYRKTRRAKRARSGGRLEVVVIAGSPSLPLTRSLALDLERKGFIVFVVCNSHEDEVMVQNLSRPDIRHLSLDTTDPPSASAAIERFAHFLQTPHAAIPQGKKHHLTLKGVLLIPSLNYQTSPIATIPPSSFADLFNTHLLHPILTIQSFLPLLTARLGPPSSSSSSSDKPGTPPPKVLVFTPSIISSISPPFHAPEATVCSALSAFTEVLTAELRPLAIPVTHIQLGTFDFSGFTPARAGQQHQQQQREGPYNSDRLLTSAQDAETLSWPDSARHTYGRNFLSQSGSAISAGRIRGLQRGSSLRDLHNAVFDVIDGSVTSETVRVGLGASVYGFVGRWVPRGLVAWMMGIRRVDELATWQSTTSSSSNSSTPRSRPRSSSAGSNIEAADLLTGSTGVEGSFVAVPEHVADAHVWKEGL